MNRRLLLIAMGIGVLLVIAGGCGKKAQGPQETEIPEPKEPLPSRTVHVFCYHGVEDDPSNFYHSRADDFVEQMQLLQERGYESISCKQLADYLAGNEDLPEQSVLISFDDGKEVVYDNACSILEEYGYRATLFINSDTIGGDGFMTWDQVKELHDRGYEIAAHTCTHGQPADRVDRHQNARHGRDRTAGKNQTREPGNRSDHDYRPRGHGCGRQKPSP
ncbi:MAG: polysaccharide deacetylase family protein [Armatimonadota bacterium]